MPQLIDALGKPGVKGWPVPLDKPVNVEGAEPDADADAAPARPAAAKPAEAKPAAPAAAKPAAAKPAAAAASPAAAGGKRKSVVKPGQNWQAGVLSKEDTESECLP
jgi:hypothetical protein